MKNDNADAICAAVRGFLASKKITMTEAAEHLGQTKSAVSSQLKGRPFSQLTARKWSEAFGFSASYLLTGEGPLVTGKTQEGARPSAISVPGELVGMFTDMAATIRSQQETVAQLSDLVGRLAGTQPQPWAAEKKQTAASIADDGLPQ